MSAENAPALLKVNEIFYSLQGESSFAGWPCGFVRLTGCPLRCAWCDTTYAYEEGEDMSLERVLAAVSSYGVDLVEVTGGEPLAQAAAPELLGRLCDAGYTVLLETSGAADISPVDERVHIIMDIKCPGSGMHERMLWSNLEPLKPTDEIKFVLAGREDYDYAKEIMARHKLSERFTVLLSPVPDRLAGRDLARWMLADKLGARFQLQLHKQIWPADMRGV